MLYYMSDDKYVIVWKNHVTRWS